MWFTELPGLVNRLIRQQEETNLLLRELHVKLTGRSALTPSRRGTAPESQTPEKTPRRTASDVWQRTPSSRQSEIQDSVSRAEATASNPVSAPVDADSTKLAAPPKDGSAPPPIEHG